jgi:hypothetical protein
MISLAVFGRCCTTRDVVRSVRVSSARALRCVARSWEVPLHWYWLASVLATEVAMPLWGVLFERQLALLALLA